ncbi:type VI secretion system Vgr family protein [Halorhodospira halophila]|uniref:Rhs element Vgr protein n=1 Tax=Halorhodospira halophila (strain DSM 244 / SL1) TaxID=349124 RepID=A1WTD7_HALHL|nr:contractile injection system protein, VgrG/Pvc8 family [Halorhodospira halophila]ABM60949.1 Rhs element Vgr protein [Halorhodospira halophila SL1]MBK1728607.1 hypothetical protein [Halorhodospira halophila]
MKGSAKEGGGAHALFRVRLPGLDPDVLRVEQIVGHQALDDGDRLQVRVCGPVGDRVREWPGQLVALTLGWGVAPRTLHGVISEVALCGGEMSSRAATLTVCSLLHPLAGSYRRRVYRRCSALHMAREVLQGALPDGVSVTVGVERSLPERPLVVQGAADDLAFLRRVLAREGCFPVVRDAGGRPEVRIVDHLAQAELDAAALTWRPGGGPTPTTRATVSEVSRRWTLQPGQVRVGGFDPALPDRGRPATAGTDAAEDSPMELGLHGVTAGGESAHAEWAEAVHEASAAQRCRIEAVVATPLLPGMRVVISGHPEASLNGAYWVYRAEHEGDQAAAIHGGGGADRVDYRGRVELLPLDPGYRPAPVPAPAIPGVAVAWVAGGDPERAEVDEAGAYRIRLFDEAEAADGVEAAPPGPPVWAVQPSAGAQHGLHLPLLPGTRVAVAGLHGDLEQPVILGALSSQDQPGPVTDRNPHQHLLRTAAGQRLLLDDRPGAEGAELAVGEAARLSLEGHEEAPGATLEAPNGYLELASGGEQRVRSGGDQRLDVAGAYRVEVEGSYHLETEDGALHWFAGDTLHLETGAGDLLHEAPDGEVALKAGRQVSLDAGSGLRLIARQGAGDWQVESGALRLEAAGDVALVSTGGGCLQLGDGFGLRIEDSGAVYVEGRHIELSAEQLVIAADRIEEGR